LELASWQQAGNKLEMLENGGWCVDGCVEGVGCRVTVCELDEWNAIYFLNNPAFTKAVRFMLSNGANALYVTVLQGTSIYISLNCWPA